MLAAITVLCLTSLGNRLALGRLCVLIFCCRALRQCVTVLAKLAVNLKSSASALSPPHFCMWYFCF